MGAHSSVRFALEQPERVAGLVLITPAYDPARFGAAEDLAGWDALAQGLREAGVEGFLAAYDFTKGPPELRPTVETVLRQRLAAHEHPDAVADALEAVPRSRPFDSAAELAAIAGPVAIVASLHSPGPTDPP